MTPEPTDQQRIAALEKRLTEQLLAEELRHQIMTGAATCSGQDYFNQMSLQLAQALKADYTLIGEIIDRERGRVRTLALCAGDQLADNIEYDLAFTPCELVLNERLCSHPQKVAELFPKDLLLTEMGIEGYVGVPLYDKNAQPLGIIVALYCNPIVDTRFAETTLQLFANLTSAEILQLQERQKRLKLQQLNLNLSRKLKGKLDAPLTSDDVLFTIIETFPNPIFFKDRLGIYTGCNQAFCDYLGIPRDKLIGHTAFDIAPQELAEVYHQADLDLMQQPGNQTYEALVKYADGSKRNILFNKATIGATDTAVTGIVGIMTDITEIQATEKEMRQLRLLLRSIVDSMPSLLITVDERQRITQWNLRAEEFTKRPASEILGQTLKQVFPDFAADLKHIDRAIKTGAAQKINKVSRTYNNRQYFVDIVIYPLLTSEIEGAVIRIDNVSDKVKMEEALVQSEKMLSLGGLAAGMAHEINNPLAGILQNLQLLRSRLLQQSPANQQAAEQAGLELSQLSEYLQQRSIPQMLEMMGTAGKRAADIVQNMLSFSRKESGDLKLCNLKEIIHQTLELAKNDYNLAKNFDFRDIDISCQLPDSLPSVMGAKSQLQQVFFNLLKNSAQALAGWEDRPKIARITIKAKRLPNMLQLQFLDNGPGISKAAQKRIFEPFFTTKEIGQGTGLGLSVSYFIITDTHHGSLSVTSTPGKGTCFCIKLPLHVNEAMYHI